MAQAVDARYGTFNDIRTQNNYTYNAFSVESTSLISQSRTLPKIENFLLSRTPPPAPSIFFGREVYVEKAVDLIRSSNTVGPARLAILGAGGMGKTSLALTIMRHPQVWEFFEGQCFFVPCDALFSPDLLLSGIMQVLGLQDTAGNDPLTVLDTDLRSSRAKLLILDNFETPLECSVTTVEQLLERIASARFTTLIVTMRGNSAPSCIRWSLQHEFCPLPCLSSDEAHNTFLAVNPTVKGTEHKEALAILLGEVDYVPLAVSLLAHLGTKLSCKVLLRRYKAEKTYLLRKRCAEPSRLDSLDVSIAMSLKSIETEPNAIELLSLISHLPSGVQSWEEKLPLMASHMTDCEAATAILLETALAHVDGNETLKVLSPVRHYMLQHHPCQDIHLSDLAVYYCDLIAKYAAVNVEGNFQIAMEQLVPEKANALNILSLCIEGSSKRMIIDAAMNFTSFLYLFSAPTEDFVAMILPHMRDLTLQRQKLQATRMWGQVDYHKGNFTAALERIKSTLSEYNELGDLLEAAQCLQNVGDIFRMQSKYEEATENLTQAHGQFRDIGNRLGAAQCLQSLGNTLYLQDKYEEAAEKLTQAQSQFRDIGNRLGVTQCLQCLGNILRLQNKYEEAAEKLTQAQNQFKETGNQVGTAQCLQSLGNILYMQDNYQEAAEKLTQAQSQFRDIGNRLGVTQCLQSLGNILYMQSKYGEAAEKVTQACGQFMETGNQLGAAQCLQKLGNILYMQAEYGQAIEKLTQAQDQFRDIGDRVGAAQCLRSLGNILYMQDMYEMAAEKFTQAQDQFRETGNQLGAAQCLQGLGDILRMQSKNEEAAEKLKQAQNQFRDIGHRVGAAQCLQSLGDILRMQSKYEGAAETLAQAQSQLRDIETAGS